MLQINVDNVDFDLSPFTRNVQRVRGSIVGNYGLRMHRAIHYPCSWVCTSWVVALNTLGWGWGVAYLSNRIGMSTKDDGNVHNPKQGESDFETDQQNWGIVHARKSNTCHKHGIIVDDSWDHKIDCQLKIVGINRVRLSNCVDPPQASLAKSRWMDICGILGAKGTIFAKDVDPAEYTTGVHGIITLLPRNAIRQIMIARRLFEL